MRDGLNSSILPNSRGASGCKGLPPRTHAIHAILFRAHPGGLTLDEAAEQLLAWGYEWATAAVTRNHLDHLCDGWGADDVVAAIKDTSTGRYLLTSEGYTRLATGPFSDALPPPEHRSWAGADDPTGVGPAPNNTVYLASRRVERTAGRSCSALSGPPVGREYRPDELIDALQRHGPRLMAQFFRPCPDLDELIRRSIAGNTFRSFQKLACRPSVLFREWAAERMASSLESMPAIVDQKGYSRHLEGHAAHLTRYWLAKGKRPLKFGPGRKLLDLLFKGIVRYAGISDADRARFIRFLHVPLDSFSLLAVRQCAASGDFGPRVAIPANAKMGFVTSAEQYNWLQQIMRRVSEAAGVTQICIDLVAWDQAHGR